MRSETLPVQRSIRKGLVQFAPLLALGVVAVGAWLAGPAAAPPPARSDAASAALWAQLDTNGDGRISQAEGAASAEFKARFEMMDVDRDGFVSDGEYRRSGANAVAKQREQQRQQRRENMGEEEEEERRR